MECREQVYWFLHPGPPGARALQRVTVTHCSPWRPSFLSFSFIGFLDEAYSQVLGSEHPCIQESLAAICGRLCSPGVLRSLPAPECTALLAKHCLPRTWQKWGLSDFAGDWLLWGQRPQMCSKILAPAFCVSMHLPGLWVSHVYLPKAAALQARYQGACSAKMANIKLHSDKKSWPCIWPFP